MSRDVTFSTRRLTRLANATTLGYAQWKAKAGDFIIYREHPDHPDQTRPARVIGQITESDRDGEPGAGRLLVLAIGDNFSFGYERWIDAADVVECYRPEHAAKFLAWLFKADPDAMFAYCRDDLTTRQAATYFPHDEKEDADA